METPPATLTAAPRASRPAQPPAATIVGTRPPAITGIGPPAGAFQRQPTALVVGLVAVVVGSGVPSSTGCGTSVVGGVIVGGVGATGGVVGSGLPSDGVVTGGMVTGGVVTGGAGGFAVGGGVTGAGGTGAGAVPVCEHRYCLLLPSCVQVSTMLPVFGRVPGTDGGAGSAIVGSGGIVGRGG